MPGPELEPVYQVSVTPDLKEALHRNQTVDNGSAYVSSKHINSGEIVAFWQQQLKLWALTQPELAERFKNMRITGDFSSCPEFTELIKEFQRVHGLEIDGIIGPRTFRAFATRFYFIIDGNTIKNLGSHGFEQTVIALISQEEYLRVISSTRRNILQYYNISPQLPKGISAKEILNDPIKLKKFSELFYSLAGGSPPISPRTFLELCAFYEFDPTLALAQAILESHCGTRGRAAFTKNIFNVGNTDDGSNRYFSSWEAGMIAYLELMKSRYGDTAEEVLGRDFVRIDGAGRYATSPNYTERIYDLVHRIRQHIDPATSIDLDKIRAEFQKISQNTIEIHGVQFVLKTPQDLPLINLNLWNDVALAALRAGIKVIYVSCLITGHSYFTKAGNKSRHMDGNAIDVAALDGHNVVTEKGKALANRLVEELTRMGYKLNTESGNSKAVLWRGDPDHLDHIHISNT
ncbi:MAG: glucosaminidase domain-containing protein, partial [Deltaproteobacteria bacterium]|nr:glucosaminidase domain-containing protein [Deltaproteobacteria bacterium]